MATKFSTVIKPARFNSPSFAPIQMSQLGQQMLLRIQQRLDRALDMYDQAAPPLAPRYAAWKQKRYGSGIRDLKASGRTRRGMAVLEAGQVGGANPYSYFKLGFKDQEALRRIQINNRRARMWAISEQDRAFFTQLVDAQKAAAGIAPSVPQVA